MSPAPSDDLRDEVVRLVLVTKTHQVADGDDSGAVLSDAALSVLAGRRRSGS